MTSLCTIVRGRRRHLVNLMNAVRNLDSAPRELVICYMQVEPFSGLPDPGCPITTIHVPGEPMRLAAARNAAARAASGDLLVFLDVDCLPAPDLISQMRTAIEAHDGIVMGSARYLLAETKLSDFERMWEWALRHPARSEPDETIVTLLDPGEFWSLCFAARKTTFERIGGFDETYRGYGGEDTDFAHHAVSREVDLLHAPNARAVHQWHPVHRPPYPHFDAIVENAARFHAKWGKWCMDYWLEMFARSGHIRWGDRIEILRKPTPVEIADARQPDDVAFG